MAIIQFPGTDFHDLNLDWVLQQVKNLLTEWASTKEEWETLKGSNEAFVSFITAQWDDFKTYVENYLAGYVIDDSLTVEGAAADAKSTGDAIANFKSEVSEQTYNLIVGKIESALIASNGEIQSNANYDLYYAPVTQNENYTAKTENGLLCGFFANKPSIGSVTYNGTRTMQTLTTITAPISGYICVRINKDYQFAQVVEGAEDKDYIPPVTAKDFVARKSIEDVASDLEEVTDTLSEITEQVEIYETVENPSITNGYYKNTSGSDTESQYWQYASVPASPGDIYRISCVSGQNIRPWIVLGSNSQVIEYSDALPSVQQTTKIVTIPENGTTLAINNRIDGTLLIEKRVSVESTVDSDKIIYNNQTLTDFLTSIPTKYLQGKKLYACGDSITAASNPSGGYFDNYAKLTAERNGMIYNQNAVSGSTMANVEGKNPFCVDRYLTVTDFDYLTIWFGWNDNAYSQLGTIDDETDTTFYGAYKKVLRHFVTTYPTKKIGIIVPYGPAPGIAGFQQAVRDVSQMFGVPCLDLADYNKCSIIYGTANNAYLARRAALTYDGTHPNQAGHDFISTMYEQFLLSL